MYIVRYNSYVSLGNAILCLCSFNNFIIMHDVSVVMSIRVYLVSKFWNLHLINFIKHFMQLTKLETPASLVPRRFVGTPASRVPRRLAQLGVLSGGF